jgi:hypothetical protein
MITNIKIIGIYFREFIRKSYENGKSKFKV